MSREIYLGRIKSAVDQLSQEKPIPLGGCSRLATAAFLGKVLPADHGELYYEMSEFDAGLRWVSVFAAGHDRPTVIRMLYRQDIMPIEGLILSVETLSNRAGHKIGIIFDEDSRNGQGIVYVDALIAPERSAVFPDLDTTLTYITQRYDLITPAGMRAIIRPGAVMPPPVQGRVRKGEVAQWKVEGITLVGHLS